MKAHVIIRRHVSGGFHKTRTIECRCGWKTRHYSARRLREQFEKHKLESGEPDKRKAVKK